MDSVSRRGVINGIGHWWGYRNFDAPDASNNIVPWGIWIGGEELHNNHHTYPTSAKFSIKWHEFDVGWVYIRALQAVKLAKVLRVAPKAHVAEPSHSIDLQTLQAVIANRYDLLAKYARSLKVAHRDEIKDCRYPVTSVRALQACGACCARATCHNWPRQSSTRSPT